MAKETPLINSFNAGELSGKVDTRSDVSKYYSGCRTLENFIPLVEGGATRTPGTYFVKATKDSTKLSRMVPFHFSTVQAYCLEVGEYYIRFYKDEGQIVGAYAAWVTATVYALGDLVTEAGSYYRCLVAHTAGVFATDLAAGYWVATDGAADLAYEIPTLYAEADLRALKFCQSADTLYVFHPTYPPKKVTRTGHTAWAISDHVCKTGDEMEITGISQADPAVVTCTTVPDTLEEGDIVYITGVVGMTELNDTYFTVGTVVTGAGGTLELAGIDSSGYAAWVSGGAAQETIYGTTDNNPSCGTFFEQRLVTAGTNNNPQTLNLSATADYEGHTLDADDDSEGIQYTIVSDRVDRIFWLMGLGFLVVGTVGGVWKIGASSSSDPISQTNVTAKKQTTMGAKNINPEMVVDALLWASSSGKSVFQFQYSLEKDAWVPLDMTRISKHIAVGSSLANSGIVATAFQKEPIPVLWAVRADGQLLGMTYEVQEQVFAWFRVVTDGSFESVAVISQDDDEDQVWVTVNRTVDGSTARYVEFFKPLEFYSQLDDAFFVHSGLTWDGGDAISVSTITANNPCIVTLAAGHGLTGSEKLRFSGTDTWLDENVVTANAVNGNDITIYNEGNTAAIDGGVSDFGTYVSGGTVEVVKKSFTTGLDHLEGESVVACADGAALSQETVTSGAITLDAYGNKIHIGLPYNSTVEPMKLHAGSQQGTARGKKQKINRITTIFYETVGGKAGPDTDNLKTIPFGTGGAPALFTGDVDLEFPGDWGNEATLVIKQDQPLPMTVLGVVPHVRVSES